MNFLRVLFILVVMAVLLEMPLLGQTKILSYDFVSGEGNDYFSGTFSYDTVNNLHRQVVPFSFTESYGSKVLDGFAIIYLRPDSGIVRLSFCGCSFGLDFDQHEHGELTLSFSDTTMNLSRPLPLPMLTETDYGWWGGSGTLLSLTVHRPSQEHELLQWIKTDYGLRDNIFALTLFSLGIIGTAIYWQRRKRAASHEK